jgi:hypothetical protein
MIRLLYDTTIGGVRFGQGALIELDATLEDGLIAEGDATQAINFSSISVLPVRIAQSFAPVVRTSDNATDTGWIVLASIVVRAGTMGANSKLVVVTDWTYTSSASVKTLAMDWGGSNVSGPAYTTTAGAKLMMEIINTNSLTTQRILNASTFTATPAAHTSTFKDTAADVAIDLKVRWSSNISNENITLLGYSIWHYPGV